MKIGFNLLLWTGHVTERHLPLLRDIKRTGYDGVEIPVFEGAPDHYARLGEALDNIGLERTVVTIMPSLDKNPLSGDSQTRKAAADHAKWFIDCSQALGATLIGGPIHSVHGHFSGAGPTITSAPFLGLKTEPWQEQTNASRSLDHMLTGQPW